MQKKLSSECEVIVRPATSPMEILKVTTGQLFCRLSSEHARKMI